MNNAGKISLTPEISIVIGTLNRPNVVLSLIKQLKEKSKKIQLEVIVVDQSLQTNSIKLRKHFPKQSNFRFYHLDTPNTCQYLNLGLREAKAPIILYLDDDVSISEGTVKAHIDTYKNPSIHGVAGRVINEGEKINRSETRVGKILWYGAIFIKNFSLITQMYVDFPYGCNMSFRKKTLEKIGGFDERLLPPVYAFNEIDLSYRINKHGKNSILFEPNALVHHYQSSQGGTRNNFTARKVFHSNQFNYGYFLGKNFTWGENAICFMRRFLYQLMNEPYAIPAILEGFIYAKKHI